MRSAVKERGKRKAKKFLVAENEKLGRGGGGGGLFSLLLCPIRDQVTHGNAIRNVTK